MLPEWLWLQGLVLGAERCSGAAFIHIVCVCSEDVEELLCGFGLVDLSLWTSVSSFVNLIVCEICESYCGLW